MTYICTAMLIRFAHNFFVVWLSVLLIFGGTAKEYVHLFTGHQDTTHSHHCGGELSFENEHHHCTFLSFALPDFVHSHFFTPFFFFVKSFQEHVALVPAMVTEQEIFQFLLRGPPASFSS
ncbi:MAG TPA: hypothetical protein PL009_11845 [Flavipsychrobacter sp.]|nr:hypothetical protein [Flavipsychrobacter sp.]